MAKVEQLVVASETYADYDNGVRESVFGSQLDTWGVEWSRADILSEDFRVLFDADIGGGNLQVESVTCEVFYSLPLNVSSPLDEYPSRGSKYVSCCVGNGPSGPRIVIAGRGGFIAYSDNKGQTWTEIETPVADDLRSVTFGAGVFIAVGRNGAIITSANGSVWSKVVREDNKHFNSVSFNPLTRKFVIGGGQLSFRYQRPSGWGIGRKNA